MKPGAVAVGVDGSPASDAALAFAMEEAVAGRRDVHAVTAWWIGPALPEEHGARRDVHHQQAERVQAAAIDRVLGHTAAPVQIHRVVAHGPPPDVLVDRARDEYLLVIGTSHKGNIKRALEGSVSADCVRRCVRPVIVVPYVETTAA